jgi:phage repressor protein C with HTH and peptisase S24 domain
MALELPDGSTVGVDRSDTQIRDGKLYALDHDGMLRVKQVHRLPGGGLRLVSFNDEYPDEEYTVDQVAEAIRVIGRVFWSAAFW